jgi:hypothetical protein
VRPPAADPSVNKSVRPPAADPSLADALTY